MFYFRNSKKALKFCLKKNIVWVKVDSFKDETVRAFRGFTLLGLHQGFTLDSLGGRNLHQPLNTQLNWTLLHLLPLTIVCISKNLRRSSIFYFDHWNVFIVNKFCPSFMDKVLWED